MLRFWLFWFFLLEKKMQNRKWWRIHVDMRREFVFAQTNESTITPQATIRWLYNISLWFKVGKNNYCLFFFLSLSLSLSLYLSCPALGLLYVCIPVPARTRTDRRSVAFYLLFFCRGLNLFVLWCCFCLWLYCFAVSMFHITYRIHQYDMIVSLKIEPSFVGRGCRSVSVWPLAHLSLIIDLI